MKKINFKKIEMYTDLEKKNKLVQDVSKDIANILYSNGKGIDAHALALKIYNTKGVEEFDESEVSMIVQATNLCAPFFIDAISEVLNSEDKHENNKE